MARLPRIVVPGVPHHVVQRGNRRQPTFFRENDFRTYLALLSRFGPMAGVEIWCYCLMPNHVHLIAVPKTPDALARGIGRTHEAYTRLINSRNGWKGYLWQGRFSSFPLDEPHLYTATRYVLMNPVKAKLVRRAIDWKWSSARAHLFGEQDEITRVDALAKRIDDWRELLRSPTSPDDSKTLRQHESTGRPLGDVAFVRKLERATGRSLLPKKPGRRPKQAQQ